MGKITAKKYMKNKKEEDILPSPYLFSAVIVRITQPYLPQLREELYP